MDGVETPRGDAASLLDGVEGHLVWVDAAVPDADELAWITRAFGLHPLEVEDITERNERPKMDDYGDHLFVVLIGAFRSEEEGHLHLAEIHVVVREGAVLTVRDQKLPAVEALGYRCGSRPELASGTSGHLFYRVCDAVVDSYLPLIDELEARIESLEAVIVENADTGVVGEIFALRRELNQIRRVVGPERDLIQSLAGPHGPMLGEDAQLYMRDVYDHAVRITEHVDGFRDVVTGALDVYLSSVNNRMTEQTRRLAVVATVFLPLTFLTGFFGMNFGILVGFIAQDWVFWGALGIMAASVPVGYVVSRILAANARPEVARQHRGRLVGPRRRQRADHVDLDVVPHARLHVRRRPASREEDAGA
ncbi:MAG TPA: magnesium/cobalt transporter CorA [Candidatus Dormibacteraeota bacterium]|nr:magnesium/cobalt transporter CorA [Candidatus Dormibacteraeota bacterium]